MPALSTNETRCAGKVGKPPNSGFERSGCAKGRRRAVRSLPALSGDFFDRGAGVRDSSAPVGSVHEC